MAAGSNADDGKTAYEPPSGLEEYLVKSLLTPCVFYDASFLPEEDATSLYTELKQTVSWEKNDRINRWVALYGDAGVEYRYRDQPSLGLVPWSDSLARVKSLVEDWYTRQTGQMVSFNVCLLNFYEDGDQRIGWHFDREEIGRTTPIASISLGAPRNFLLKSKSAVRGQGPSDEASVRLANGSLLIMENICQHIYVHALPSTKDANAARVNLTFRCKLEQTAGEVEHERRQAPAFMRNPPPAVSAEPAFSGSEVFGDDQEQDTAPEPSGVQFLVNAQLGTERYLAAEMEELLAPLEEPAHIVARPWGLPGFVSCSTAHKSSDGADTLERLLRMRSAMSILRYHHHFLLSGIKKDDSKEADSKEGVEGVDSAKDKVEAKLSAEDLYAHVKSLLEAKAFSIAELAVKDKAQRPSFRVSCNRMGSHAFNSAEVEREVGGALQEYYDAEADMTNFDLNIRVDVVGDWLVIGTQCHERDLSLRHKMVFVNRVTVKSNIAYILLRAAGVKAGDTVLDPFCGSGTLILEAAEWLKGDLKGIGLDMNRKATNGANANAAAEGFAESCKFHCSDARALRKICPDESVDAVVTNVPWGVRVGTFVDLEALGPHGYTCAARSSDDDHVPKAFRALALTEFPGHSDNQ
eukprot:TRINITY_DN31171_c0_g1_i2.p1 TRINITY_DN31171_c0_g1~~TRINITY_DN31171_c0_g1_i2.p1  ORF type:complete len:649 (+),score=129.08 TRINITY_DN31171_c0_g1_i2:42-1949(+)